MKRIGILVSAFLVAAPAFATMPKNWEVNPVNDIVYEVVSEGAYSGAAFWCAAGDYVERVLKRSPRTEIYVYRKGGPSVTTNRKTAAQFTLDPAAAGITPTDIGSDINELVVGGHMQAGLARNFCSTG